MLFSIDHVILVGYLVGIYLLGVWCSRRQSSAAEFMSAGGRLPAWAVGLSIFGTFFSSISFLALPSKAFAADWNFFVFSLTIPVAALVAHIWFVPFYRQQASISAYEHLEQRFGPWARSYAVLCYLLTQLTRSGMILYLLAVALHPLTGWSIPLLIVIGGLVVIGYTLIGGMEAVVWTDVVQSLIFIVGAIVVLVTIIISLPGQMSQLTTTALAENKFSLGALDLSFMHSTFWVVAVYGLFVNLQNFGIDQSYIQRYQTARDLSGARRSVWLGAGLYPPISAMFFLIGTGLFVFYRAFPTRIPTDLVTQPDLVFPYFIQHELPWGVPGLVIAAISAAAQSTVSSSINCSATLIYQDVYRRYVNPQATEAQSLRILRWTSLTIGCLAIGTGLAMIQIKQAIDVWWKLAGIFSGGMLGLFLLGRLVPQARSRAALMAVSLTVLTMLWMVLTPLLPASWCPAWFRNPLHEFFPIVVGTLEILLLGWLFSRGSATSRNEAATVSEKH